MNDNARAWVAALRSGEWKQAQQALRKPAAGEKMSYCCLGVACEMSGLGRWDGLSFRDQVQQECSEDWCDTCDGCCRCSRTQSEEFASPMVQEWLGLATEDGKLTNRDGSTTSLAMLNDEGRSFSEIAEIIEANADELFAERPTVNR